LPTGGVGGGATGGWDAGAAPCDPDVEAAGAAGRDAAEASDERFAACVAALTAWPDVAAGVSARAAVANAKQSATLQSAKALRLAEAVR
jgi:hypothetical protein